MNKEDFEYETENSLLLGCAKMDITPPYPIELAGFAHRKGGFSEISHPLYVRVAIMQHSQMEGDGQGIVLLLSADLLWWGSERVIELKRKIHEKWNIDPSAIILHATHNHSGPQTSMMFTPSLGTPDEAYLIYMENRVMESIESAFQNMEPVKIRRGSGKCEIGVNRRKLINGTIHMLPNPSGPTNPEVTVIQFIDQNDKTKSVFVHYSCHPTTTGDNKISSEFPGVAMEKIEKELGSGATALFLQGCCADIRPNLVQGEEFFRGSDKEVRKCGHLLADEVQMILKRPMKSIKKGSLITKTKHLRLPFQQLPNKEHLENFCNLSLVNNKPNQHTQSSITNPKLQSLDPNSDILKQWAEFLLANPEKLLKNPEMELTLLELSKECVLLFTNAEMVSDYGSWIKQYSQDVMLPICYSNGMIGYITTAKQLHEGGYEGLDYIYYFGLPAPLSADTEDMIQEEISSIYPY